MAAGAARSGLSAERSVGFEEAEIRRKMSEIADWLKVQADEPEPIAPPAPPAALNVVPDAPANDEPGAFGQESSINTILQRRLAARREREEVARLPDPALGSVLDQFCDPAESPEEGDQHGTLRAAVAEIVERQRSLESDEAAPSPEAPPALVAEPPKAPFVAAAAEEVPPSTPVPAAPDLMAEMEGAFERLASQFERRAEQTFQTFEASLEEVSRLIREAPSAADAAEAALRHLIETRVQTLEADTNERIDEISRDVADLRAETETVRAETVAIRADAADLRADSAEMRSDAAEAERRMRELLDTVRQMLEHVVARLPDRPGTQAPALAPAVSQAAPSPARAAVPPAPAPAQDPAHDIELMARDIPAGPERQRFLAAARRSVQAEPLAKPKSAAAAMRAALQPRTETTPRFGQNRVLLASVAAAALVFGIYTASSYLLDGVFSEPELAMAPIAGETQSGLVQPSTVTPNEAAPAPAPASAAQPAASAALQAPDSNLVPAEPAFTASIPQTPVKTFDPPPAAVGGQMLRDRAAAGDAAAQYEVGMRFAEGRGVQRDLTQAATWLQRAADQGLAPAQYRLGSLLENGQGLPKDVHGARQLYEKAASAGNIQAMHNLGVLYAEGGLGQADMAVAVVWFRKAADYGVKDSQFNLGIFYARGLSVPQDLSESYLWFSLAAAQGDADAASKRDQIGAKLSADKLSAAKVSADIWKPKVAAVEANEVLPPAGGWDSAAQAKTH